MQDPVEHIESLDDRNVDVALFMPAFTLGGVERIRLNLAEAFVEAGLAVDLVVLSATGPLLAHVPEGVRVVELGVHRMWASLGPLVRYLRRVAPRTVISALDYANVAILLARRIAGGHTRVFVGTHKILSLATAESALLRERLLMLPMVRHTYPRAAGLIAVSDGIAEDLGHVLGKSAPPVHVMHNPALTDRVLALSEERPWHPWLADAEIACHTLVSVGRLDRQKDFPMLMKAFTLARRERPELRLVIVGEGEERSRLERQRAEMGLSEVVDFPGYSTNPWCLMRHAALFVSSSAWEGFGNVHVEALGCGCPVVSTDSPSGPADILDHGRFGRLVPVGDHESLAKAILATLGETPDRTRLRERGADFHVRHVVNRYCAMLGV